MLAMPATITAGRERRDGQLLRKEGERHERQQGWGRCREVIPHQRHAPGVPAV